MPRASNGAVFVKVVLSIVTALLVAGIGGGISGMQRISVLEANQAHAEIDRTRIENRLESIENKVDRLLEKQR